MDGNNMISIKFEHTDENGCFFSAESKVEPMEEFGGALGELSMAFNTFLRQIGYTFFNKDYILMKSLDEEEYEALESYLEEYRKRKAENR